MTEKPYTKIGNTYYPNPQKSKVSDTEIKGNWWRAWLDNERYFYEFDAGHFAPEIKVVEISGEDFQRLKAGKISATDLSRKYG